MQTILVCDDDKQIVEAIDIYLTGEGFKVIKAMTAMRPWSIWIKMRWIY